MASDDLGRSGSDRATGGGPVGAGGGEKGIFDHLAEYLLQQPITGANASAPPPAPEATAPPIQQQADRQAPSPAPAPPGTDEPELRSQEPAFDETAEQLVVEKEVVREEAVPGKPVEEHVQDRNDSLRRAEVEVERITPAEPEPVAKATPPPVVDLREPVARPDPAVPPEAASVQPHSRAGEKVPTGARESLTWWAWYALILGAGLLIAFALGQLIGSPGS